MSADAPCWFALIEHWDAPYVREHAHLLRRTASAHGDRILHVTPSMWTAFLAEVLRRTSLSAAEREKITSMHLPRVTAYGVGPNKAALLAASANVGYLHRRDSDQIPDTATASRASRASPRCGQLAARWQTSPTDGESTTHQPWAMSNLQRRYISPVPRLSATFPSIVATLTKLIRVSAPAFMLSPSQTPHSNNWCCACKPSTSGTQTFATTPTSFRWTPLGARRWGSRASRTASCTCRRCR